MSSAKVLAIDIETSGLDPWRDEIYMVGLYDGVTYKCCRSPKELEVALRYRNWDLVGHNVAFDIKFLEVQGWWKPNGRTIHDTKILAHMVKNKVPAGFIENYEAMRKEKNKQLPKGQTHREASALSLKVLAPWYLKVPPFWETPGNHNNEEYNQLDCMYTYRLFHLLSEQVQSEGSWGFYVERMLEWSKMVREMEITGISISNNELDLVEREYTAKRDSLKKKLDELWMGAHHQYRFNQENELLEKYNAMAEAQIAKGKDPAKTKARYYEMYKKALPKIEMQINYASPAQMSWLLKDYLKLDITDPEGEESTGKAVLNKLAADGREDIKTYLDWREADKVLTMYLPTYQELQVDGVIHPNFNLTGTRTGRTSSSGPNLQQVPPKLYRLFKPRPGYKFIQYDLSGIEAALIALYSGDKRLYEILEKGDSIHDHNAKALFGLTCEVGQVGSLFPRERKCAKTIGFACFYGAGWRRIKLAFAAAGFPISDSEAKEKLQKLKAYYPEAFEFHKEITQIFEAGESVTNLIGRPINLQPHENPYMQGFNTLIQSSASDLNLLACERFWKRTKDLGANVLAVIHDAILCESPAEHALECERILVDAMTNFKLESANGPIKPKVEGGVSDSWEK